MQIIKKNLKYQALQTPALLFIRANNQEQVAPAGPRDEEKTSPSVNLHSQFTSS